MNYVNILSNPLILVGTPVYYGCEVYFDTLIDSWRQLTYPSIKFCLVENNTKSETLHHKLEQLSFIREPGDLSKIYLNNSHLENWQPLTQAQNEIRSFFLSNEFEFLLINEATRTNHPDIIETLLTYNLKVVGAIYKDSWHPGYYCVYDYDAHNDLHLMDEYRFIDSITEPKQVNGIGFGIILIHRSILQTVSFRSATQAADTYFAEDLNKMKIPIYAAPILVKNLKVEMNIKMVEAWEQARRL